mmetsp:Transcript_45765/g.83840  ORF Transcript_45765/g.83840 Transcript_45765/m.83840 type:complete len:138 (+) Transcript_45765:109-522(+)
MDVPTNRDQRTPLATAAHDTGKLQSAEDAALAVEVDAHEHDTKLQDEAVRRISEEAAKIQQVVWQLNQHAQQQGEVIDSIESSVYDAESNTSSAQVELQVTEQGTRRQTHRACIALLVAVLIGAIIILVVLLKAEVI